MVHAAVVPEVVQSVDVGVSPKHPPKVSFLQAPKERPRSLYSAGQLSLLSAENLFSKPWRCLFLFVLGVYVLVALTVAVWCIKQSIHSDTTQWPPIERILPLVVLNSPGSWAIALPMTLGAKTGEPMGRFLAAAAVLPPAMAGQLLARIAVGVELQQSRQVELVAICGGLIQFFLLLLIGALRSPSTSFPLPFLLGLVTGLGDAIAVVFLPLILEMELENGVLRALMSLLSFVLVGSIAQLSWGFRSEAIQSYQTKTALRLLRQCTRHIRKAFEDDEGPILISHYEETMKLVDAVGAALKQQPNLTEEVLEELGYILVALKATLTSGKLYKTEVRGGYSAPNAQWGSSVSDGGQQMRQVQQILESECEPVEHIKPRHSLHSHSDPEDELPHALQASGKMSLRSPRSLPSAVGVMTDEQLRFLAQMHRGYESSEQHTMSETFERMDKREAAELGRWKFDAYALERQHGNALLHAGFLIGSELLEEAGVKNFIQPLRGFLQDVQKQYHQVPYHNHVHAADVLSSSAYFLREDRRVGRQPLGAIPRLSTFVAAVIHDVGHFGRTNRYHIASHDPVAVLYNDQSPLENMHCTIGFSILRQPHSALFEHGVSQDACSGLQDANFTLLRRIVIESVLATDMSKHFDTLSRFKAAINYAESPQPQDAKLPEAPIWSETAADRSARLVSIFLKAADLGHAAKPLEITRQMTIRIHMEFFAQGEEERELGLPISPLCDRNEVNIAQSQVGFLHHLVLPLYKAVHFFMTSDEFLEHCLNRLEANLSHWQSPTPCVVTDDIPQKSCSGDSTAAPQGVFPQEQIVKLINGFECE